MQLSGGRVFQDERNSRCKVHKAAMCCVQGQQGDQCGRSTVRTERGWQEIGWGWERMGLADHWNCFGFHGCSRLSEGCKPSRDRSDLKTTVSVWLLCREETENE